MRVLVVSPSVDLLGGAEKHVLELSKALASVGVHIEVVAPRFVDDYAGSSDARVKVRRLESPGSYARRLGSERGAAKTGAAGRGPSRADQVIFLSWYFWRMVREARQSQADIVHAHTLLLPSLAAAFSGKPFVVTLHGGEIDRLARGYRPLKPVYRWVLRRAAAIIAVSRPLETAALELGARKEGTFYIPNGVDTFYWGSLEARPAKPTLRVVCNRRLDRKNGIDVLLRAAALVQGQPVEFKIIGRGPEEFALRKLAEELRLSNVEFQGFLSEDEMRDAIQSAHVAVLPSRMEGLPLSMLEAMAAGKAVIVTPIGGMPDLVSGNGLIVPVDDPAALADSITRLCENPRAVFEMGKRSREIIEEGYTWTAAAASVVKCYSDVLSCSERRESRTAASSKEPRLK